MHTFQSTWKLASAKMATTVGCVWTAWGIQHSGVNLAARGGGEGSAGQQVSLQLSIMLAWASGSRGCSAAAVPQLRQLHPAAHRLELRRGVGRNHRVARRAGAVQRILNLAGGAGSAGASGASGVGVVVVAGEAAGAGDVGEGVVRPAAREGMIAGAWQVAWEARVPALPVPLLGPSLLCVTHPPLHPASRGEQSTICSSLKATLTP